MPNIVNNLLRGRMNKDDDDRLIANGEYRDALNIMISTSEGSDIGAAQNHLGNTKMADLATLSGLSVTGAVTIGAISVSAINKVYWFVTSVLFDGIYEYDKTTGTSVRVVQTLKGGRNALNFQANALITGVNYINGLLYWTDNYNAPRKINIERAKLYVVDDINISDDISVIVRPPLQSLIIEPKLPVDELAQNNLSEKMIRVAYRFKYKDGEFSALSPWTTTMFKPDELGLSYLEGNTKMVNKWSELDITFTTGNQHVTDVQLVYADERSINIMVIDTLNKEKLGYSDDESYTVNFKNNKIYSVLPATQTGRLFDNVPLRAKAQDIIGGRLAYGNYVQFFKIENDDTPIPLDYTIDLISSDVENSVDTTMKTGRNYEIALLYLDEYGRQTTALATYNSTYFIPYTVCDKANSLEVTINHDAPDFATHFRLAIKQDKEGYYNIFPRIYYIGNDGFKYFLINDSDLDKPQVNKYIVVKSRDGNAVLTGKKYKVLEVAYKSEGFLNGGEIAGLYFKIKTTTSEFNGEDVFTNNTYAVGSTATAWQLLPNNKSRKPVTNPTVPSATIEKVYYADNANNAALTVTLEAAAYDVFEDTFGDARYEIEVFTDGVQQFRYRNLYSPTYLGSYPLAWEVDDVANALVPYDLDNGGDPAKAKIQFTSPPIDGDRWVLKIKTTPLPFVYRSDAGKLRYPQYTTDMWNDYEDGWNGYSVGQNSGSQPVAIIPSDISDTEELVVKSGAEIRINIEQDFLSDSPLNEFTSGADYDNIEEWFFESGAWANFNHYDYDGENIGIKGVRFRKCVNWNSVPFDGAAGLNEVTLSNTGPTRMFIIGYEGNEGDNDPLLGTFNTRSFLKVDFSMQQLTNITSFETDPIDQQVDIYHELPNTYRVLGDRHIVGFEWDTYEDDGFGNVLLKSSAKLFPHNFTQGTKIFVKQVSVIQPLLEGEHTVMSVKDSFGVVINLPYASLTPPYTQTPGHVLNVVNSVAEQNQTGFQPAKIIINNPTNKLGTFNAFSFGNGVESDRIRDDFNEAYIRHSKRTTTAIDQYDQERRSSSITWSEPFSIDTKVNRLNEFNLSTINFKNLDVSFGSVQKLRSRDTDLMVFQENKVSAILFNKTLLSDAIGSGQITTTPAVFGNQITLNGEWGISNNPESFSEWGELMFFTDRRRGAIIEIAGNAMRVISDTKMTDYFNDHFKLNNNFNVGGYDVHTHQYVISHVEDRGIYDTDEEIDNQ